MHLSASSVKLGNRGQWHFGSVWRQQSAQSNRFSFPWWRGCFWLEKMLESLQWPLFLYLVNLVNGVQNWMALNFGVFHEFQVELSSVIKYPTTWTTQQYSLVFSDLRKFWSSCDGAVFLYFVNLVNGVLHLLAFEPILEFSRWSPFSVFWWSF